MTSATTDDLLAAIDLGSNSFHMIVARLHQGQLRVVDRVRERVRLGAGLDERQHLTAPAQARALETLARFGERLRGMPRGRVRAVGTNTLRRAKNGQEFLARAREVLGHAIEIVPGREEARLIYLGVQQSLPADGARRLVVDIGGGSTECVIGERDEIMRADSLFMGCVSYSMRYFGEGALTEAAFERAELAASLELQPIVRAYRGLGWQVAVGCSGTVHAVKKIARANGWSNGDLTGRVLRKIRKAMVAAEHVDELDLPGLQEDRRPVLAGGIAILRAVFGQMEIEHMVPSSGALREGALYDLAGRIQHEDVRDRTIRGYCTRHAVDLGQARRVEQCAVRLLHQTAHAWDLDLALSGRVLSWAAHLHEIGLTISHTGFHRHAAYIVRNADMAGFSLDDQIILAAVIGSHRRKFKRSTFDEVPDDLRRQVIRIAVLFRLAVALSRGRADDLVPALDVEVRKRKLILRFPSGWLEAHPLTRTDLEEHAAALESAKLNLEIAETED